MFSRADEYRRRAMAAKQRTREARSRRVQEAFEESAEHWLALAHQAERLKRRGHVRLSSRQDERE